MRLFMVAIIFTRIPSRLLGLAFGLAGLLLAPSLQAWPVNGGGGEDDLALAVARADSGNVYLAGRFQGVATYGTERVASNGLYDLVVMKLTASGNVIWARSAGSSTNDEALAIALDRSENVYITGYYGSDADFDVTTLRSSGSADGFVAKLDLDGNWKWVEKIEGSGFDRGTAIDVLDGDVSTNQPGRVFVAVERSKSGGSSDQNEGLIAAWDTDGAFQWEVNVESASNPEFVDVMQGIGVAKPSGPLFFLRDELPYRQVLLKDDFNRASLGGDWQRSAGSENYINIYWDGVEAEALYLSGAAVNVASRSIDASMMQEVSLSYRVKKGRYRDRVYNSLSNESDSNTECQLLSVIIIVPSYECIKTYSESPDAWEDLVVEYLNEAQQWVELSTHTYLNTPSAGYLQRTITLPEDALWSGLRVRYRQKGGSGRFFDFWHIDDVRVEGLTNPDSYVGRLDDIMSGTPKIGVESKIPLSLDINDLAVDQSRTHGNIVVAGERGSELDDGSWTGSCHQLTQKQGAYMAVLNPSNLSCLQHEVMDGGTAWGAALDDAGDIYLAGNFSGEIGFSSQSTGRQRLFSTLAEDGTSSQDLFVAKLSYFQEASAVWWEWDWLTGGDRYDTLNDPHGLPGRGGGSEEDELQDLVASGSGELWLAGGFSGVAWFGDERKVESLGGQDQFVAHIDANGRWFDIQTWTVGEAISPPPNAKVDDLVYQPEALIDGVRLSSAEFGEYFFWAPPVNGGDARLVPLQPVSGVQINWRVQGETLQSEARVSSFGTMEWPTEACSATNDQACYQIHIAEAWVELAPEDGSYTFLDIRNPKSGGSGAQEEGGRFSARDNGFSVLLYVAGPTVEYTNYPMAFEVVRTLPYQAAPEFTDGIPWEIGKKITDPGHDEPGRTGFVVNANSFHDGAGAEPAYNREERSGAIIPVNRYEPLRGDDAGKQLVVAWYRKNAKNVYWPVKPVEYQPHWPLDPERIIIASEQGGEVLGQAPLDGLVYQGYRIYQQNDPDKPGFNPNDEHAMFAPSNLGSGFDAIYALRADFGGNMENDRTAPSDPYVLVKYFDPVENEWAFRIYKVQATGAGYSGFRYSGVAGTTVSPPYPLRLLASCTATRVDDQQDQPHPFFQDYKGQLWARSAGRGDVFYYYPLSPGFYFQDGEDSLAEEGTCIPWQAKLPADQGGSNSPNNPVKVHYDITWPADVPTLVAGETLLEPKNGLPDIHNQAAVEIVYDQLQATLESPQATDTLAQLIDPLNPRAVYLDAIPGAVARSYGTDGKQVIQGSADGVLKLPVSLRNRLSYDPLNQKLAFKGIFDQSGAGEPLLLLNIMSERERVLLKQLDGGDGSEAADYADGCGIGSACSWDQAVEALFRQSRNPQGVTNNCGLTTLSFFGWDIPIVQCESVGANDVLPGWQDRNGDGVLEPFQAVGVQPALTAGFTQGSGYLTLAFNNDPSLNPAPVSLSIIRVDCLQSPPPPTPPAEADVYATYQGQIQIISPDNIFDEQLVLRHSGDFGGQSDQLEFEWYYHPDTDGTPPQTLPDPENGQMNGWLKFPVDDPLGAVEISIEGANIQTLSDNWFIARYRGLGYCNNEQSWSLWAGQPGGTPLTPRAQLAEGWVKRVVKRLNPFEARVQDFGQAETNNYTSMLIQLGERYEGDIALNSDPAYINSVGLIEAYETVMRRAMSLSIDSTPPVNYEPANAAILLIASRLADFYTLLGNEAYADAQDPTIGLTHASNIYGVEALAPSIFNFQNQLASLLEEELVLLRGRDDGQGPVAANPVYNRLFWNFTTGDGEVAYNISYNISDQDGSGVINETDARILYPQGHGDAWGHYLTALDYYYGLLNHPYYTWNPRPEAITVAGVPLQVDFLDERQFAEIAAAKARAGAEIVDLTYRNEYVEDPAGQWQGYKDSDEERAWGLAEWGARAGQGAYFDWVTANAILQAEDPDPDHQGIQKVDRTTVEELDQIVSEYIAIQQQVDEADLGLNPLGLAKGVVPFDIDPSAVDAGKTHFEQVYERAESAMDNAVQVWDFANTLNRMLRNNQDSTDDLVGNAIDTERDFKGRLIEIFGYPYDDDIGPGGLYPAGYDGPDLYHYMVMDVPELAGTAFDIVDNDNLDGFYGENDALMPSEFRRFSGSYAPSAAGMNFFTIVGEDPSLDCGGNPGGPGCNLGNIELEDYTDDETSMSTRLLTVEYTTLDSDLTGFTFTKDLSWTGQRRAPGELQNIQAQMIQGRVALQRAAREYDNLRQDIDDQIDTIQAVFDIRQEQIAIANQERRELMDLSWVEYISNQSAAVARRTGEIIENGFTTAQECIPDTLIVGVSAGGDVLAGVKCTVKGGEFIATQVTETIATVAEGVGAAAAMSKEDVPLQAGIELQIQDARLELFDLKGDLDKMLRQEPLLRAEIYAKAEELRQLTGSYNAALAQGLRLLEELQAFRRSGAAAVQQYRYQDMGFRIFRNDALQKYRAAFDMAARYVYLAASAYDYETNLLGSVGGSGQEFLTDIVRERSLGQILDGQPVAGSPGLADPMARMKLNFEVLKGQMGFNNPQTETNRFSLRRELFRILDEPDSDERWRRILEENRVANLWDVPEFRRYMRPFAPESAGPQPGIVLRFPTTVTFGLNFFGWELGPADSAYDPSHYATRIRGVGAWFEDYAGLPLSNTPRIYLAPTGADVLRAAGADDFSTREWTVLDQVIPVPFPIGSTDLEDVDWIPAVDSVVGSPIDLRRYASFRAHHYSEPFDDSEIISDSRLIGRSVWNREWLLIIPGGTLLYDADEGLDLFINGREIPGGGGERDGNGVSDIKLFFQTYSYSGS